MTFKSKLFALVVSIFVPLPLSRVQNIGSMFGRVANRLSAKTSLRLKTNLLKTQIATINNVEQIAQQTASEIGKTFAESLFITWQSSPARCAKFILKMNGLDELLQVATAKQPILLLTPHIGNFEIAIKSLASYLPNNMFTLFYKPIKEKWLEALMVKGRTASNMQAAPTTTHGIKTVLNELRHGGIVGMLPDHVAKKNSGIWVNFFNQPVYATPLVAKLILLKDVRTFISSSVRVDNGFVVDFVPYRVNTSNTNYDDAKQILQELYHLFEDIISKHPTQYYWSYNRFRNPNNH